MDNKIMKGYDTKERQCDHILERDVLRKLDDKNKQIRSEKT